MADTSSNNDVTSQNGGTSGNDTARGLSPRTQSYTSVASSQVSRQSTLPDYNFDEDDRPGKYKSAKTKDKKPAKKVTKPSKADKKAEKGDKKKESEDKKKQIEDKKTKTVEKKKKEKETKPKKAVKSKENTKKTSDKKVKTEKEKKKKDENKSKSKDDFHDELESAVSTHAENTKVEEDNGSFSDAGFASQGEISMTSRDSSISRGNKAAKSKKKKMVKKGKKSSSWGKKKPKPAKNKKPPKRRKSESSFGDLSDVTSRMSDDIGYSDFTTDDEREKKNKKKVKKTKKGKNKGKPTGPVIITVNEDGEESNEMKNKRKSIFGIIPVPSKREPLVYSCCMCCSLGAGSLLTGLIFVIFSISYLVVRANELKLRNNRGIWIGENLLPDVWRLLLVIGMLTASLCLLASLLLIIASCLWGQKEHYKRLRRCITFWIVCTLTAGLINIGEAVYVQAMPNIVFEYFHSSESIEMIKENSMTLWIMTGFYTIIFLYLVLVLISYLRLLKYMDSPKIGSAPTPAASNPVTPSNAPTKKKPQPQSRSISNIPSESSVQTVSEVDPVPQPKKRTKNLKPDRQEIPNREEKREMKTRSRPKDMDDRIYENTNFRDDDVESGPSAPISRAGSELSLIGPGLSQMKTESFKDVINDITNDAKIFDNMSKPKPLKRMPNRKPRPKPTKPSEEIYMNFNFDPSLSPDSQPTTAKLPSYSQVTKPLKRANSLSDVRGPVYDNPPPEIDFDEMLRKREEKSMKPDEKSRNSSKDTGFNSLNSLNSSTISNDGSPPDISEMERLTEQLKKEQAALDKAGNCDPAVAENLTQMALNALKLSEKILQDVKLNGKNQAKKSVALDPEPATEDLNVHTSKLATQFFDQLSKDPSAISGDPIEEMFRMYGKDLCCQNPEMVNRYLMSYKTIQDGKVRQHQSIRPGSDISETVMNEQKPWRSILNPSEAIPAMSPIQNMQQYPPGPPNPLMSMSQNSMSSFPHPNEDPRRTQSAFAPIHPNAPQMSQPFHTVSHAQNGPTLSNNFYPIEYPQQNSASYKPEPPVLGGPQNSMVPYNPPPQYDPRHMNKMGQRHPQKPLHPESMYYDEECPYSCCYGMYDDYGSVYGEYGPYPYPYSDYGGENGMYNGSNWFPLGDPAYTIDPYYNPYEFWDEPAPPYTERSTNASSYRTRTNSRGYDSKAGSSSRGYTSKAGSSSKGYTIRTGSTSRGYSRDSSSSRGYSKDGFSSRGYDSKAGSSSRGYDSKSRSMPNLMDEDLYSEGQSSISGQKKLAQWGIKNDSSKDLIGRPQSRGVRPNSPKRANSFTEGKDSQYSYLKGYKAALREALTTLSSKNDQAFSRKKSEISNTEEFIEKLISQAGDRRRSKSLDRTYSQEEKYPRTFSSDSRIQGPDTRNFNREPERNSRTFSQELRAYRDGSDDQGHGSRNRSRASGVRSRGSVSTEKLSSALSRKTSKLSFRPASRPGQLLIDDPYEDYRSTSSIPPGKNDMDEFGMSRKSSRSSVGFRNISRASEHSDDILSTFELMTSHGGRPSTRSRLSNRSLSRDRKKPIRSDKSAQNSDITYPYSDSEVNFYNKLDLEVAYPDKHIHKERDSSKNFASGRNSAPLVDRSRSANDRVDSKNDKSVLWFMGEDDRDPIYSSEYGDLWTGDSAASSHKRGFPRSSSFTYRDTKQQDRLESFGSSKRKVTFGSSPHIREEKDRRTSWNQ